MAQTGEAKIPDDIRTPSDVRMLTVTEAAALLGVSVAMLRQVVMEGEILFIPWGNERRVPVWELRRWQQTRMTNALSERKILPMLDAMGKTNRYRGKRKSG